MNTFSISPIARADLDEIWNYIGLVRANPTAASRQIEKIREAMFDLALHAFSGQLRDELSRGVRSRCVGNYVIYYRPTDSGIEVVSVIHGARDVEALFRERNL